MPTPNTTVGADGKLIVNAKQSQGLFLDDRHQTGTAIGTTGGIDIPDENAQYRMQLTDGFYKNEKTILPKQLNLVSLQNKAKNRSNEEEAVLTAARNKRLADQRNLEKNIADQKLNAPAFDPKWLEVQIPRFNVPIQYTGFLLFISWFCFASFLISLLICSSYALRTSCLIENGLPNSSVRPSLE